MIADNPLFSLSGKTALVTGGAQGLGRMIAEGLVEAGADVFITSRHTDLCELAAAEVGAHALCVDAGTPDGIMQMGAAFRASGRKALHVLVNNAGAHSGAPLEEFPDEAWPGVMAVNVQAPFRTVQEFLPELGAAATSDDPTRVINIGSVVGTAIIEVQGYSYVASKAALHHISRQLARDLVSRHINVNTIVPGFFATSMTAHLRENPDARLENRIPMKRLGRAADIVGAAVFLASPASAYLTGVEIPVDGGILGCR